MLKDYYSSLLSPNGLNALKALRAGIFDQAEQIMVPYVSKQELSEVIMALKSENPRFFYCNYWAVSYSAYLDGSAILVRPEYFDLDKIDAVKEAFKKALKEIPCFPYDPLKQVSAIVNWMSRLRYKNNKGNDVHAIHGPLLRKEGVCEGFSMLFHYFCLHFGIDSMICYGEVEGYGDAHAWNVVNIAGKLYNVDMTVSIDVASRFGCPLCNVLVPDYVLFDYKSISKPYCGVLNDNPYFASGMAFSDLETLKRKCQKISEKKNEFTLMDVSIGGVDVLAHFESLNLGRVRRVSNIHRLYIFYT